MSVQRIYVEKRPGFDHEAQGLLKDLQSNLGITSLAGLRLINRYDVEGLTPEDFDLAVRQVFSEPQADDTLAQLPDHPQALRFALEYLPGQFDQRADSAEQCIQLITQKERPVVQTARVYLLFGELSPEDVERIKGYLLNPVESRFAREDMPSSLQKAFAKPGLPPVLAGFRALDAQGMAALRQEHQLAMEEDDLLFCRDHFEKVGRDPSLTELKVIDTYWSDHCRHTTFFTELTEVSFEHPAAQKTWEAYKKTHDRLRPHKPYTLMDIATLAAKALCEEGRTPEWVQSEENNACTIRVTADTKNGPEEWLLLFKNETHNHPTEIEPFGGAATCIGGAIRDPLSARAYVYAAMRVTGAADPKKPIKDTLPGKLPQRSIVLGAANGYSSYGNQIGLPTGQVKEYYHQGYEAKRMEIGAVLGAAPESQVRRERPQQGDVVILVGGRTGRDGIGGATGSSLSHEEESVTDCASQVQKGNAPEERKLQRLFLDPKVTRLIKRCNDFGAGGVSVAIGELCPGLMIDLDRVPLKYQGLNGTEIAISESQERMAVVVEEKDAADFLRYAKEENLEATVVAWVTSDDTLTMRFLGQTIVDIPRAFLDTNGAPKKTRARVAAPKALQKEEHSGFAASLHKQLSDLNGASLRGLAERFDATIGAGTLLAPFGGRHQITPPMAMAHLLPVPGGTSTMSVMGYGFDPVTASRDPYAGGYLAVVEALTTLAATGADPQKAYLTLQEYFPKPEKDPVRWGLPLAALLGAYRAQSEFSVAAIGGKDSMSGTFKDLDVPPTLVAFAVAAGHAKQVISPELKEAGNHLVWLVPSLGEDGLPQAQSVKEIFARVRALAKKGLVRSAATTRFGGAAYALTLMALGNRVGVELNEGLNLADLFEKRPGSLILEVKEPVLEGIALGRTVAQESLTFQQESLPLSKLLAAFEAPLESVFVSQAESGAEAPTLSYAGKPVKGPRIARPRVLIPAFPGTNCEEDTARAFDKAGADPRVLVVRNLTAQDVRETVLKMAEQIRQAQIVFLPGGFSGGDEPDGSAKLITAFLRAQPIQEALEDLLKARQGLLGGICNGFQALIKAGFFQDGFLESPQENSPTLAYNHIGRHQSRLVRVRVASTMSPWYQFNQVGSLRVLPVSHGEGRLVASQTQLEEWARKGQIATQYADLSGKPSMDILSNPNGSLWAVESLTSPDGRVMGRMGHAERAVPGLYRNFDTTGEDPMFRAAVAYFA